MKLFRIIFAIALSAAIFTGCDDTIEEPPFTIDFEIDDSKITGGELTLADAAYNNNVILSANTSDWIVEVLQTGKWLTATKLSEGDSHRANIKAEENTGFDMREAEVVFKYQGQQVGKFKVKQLGSNMELDVAADDLVQNLEYEESEFDVVIRTNITDYTITYEYDPEGDKDWIEEIEDETDDVGGGTRAVESASKTHRFKALTNGFDTRSGKIVFTSGDIIRKVTVNQLGEIPDILVDETAITLLYNDPSLEIDVMSNIPYNVDVVYTDGNGWLTIVPGTRALIESKAKFTVSTNETDESRTATVVFTYKDAGKSVDIRREVPVTQAGVSISVSDPSGGTLELPFAGSTFTVKIASNAVTAPTVEVPAWMTQQGAASFANGIYTYTFSYGDNNTLAPLTGNIKFMIYDQSVEVEVTQAIGAIYQDQIAVLGVSATQPSQTVADVTAIYNGNITDNWEKYNAPGETVTFTFQLAEAVHLSRILYYRKGVNNSNAHSMSRFELLTSDTANGEFVSHGWYTVETASDFQKPYTFILDEPLLNPKFVRMVCEPTAANTWITCAEMQFFQTSLQNDEYISVTSTNLPKGKIEDGIYIPATGGSYEMTVSANVDYTFECSSGVTVSEKPATRALPERSAKEWIINVGESGPLWRAHFIKIKKTDGTVMYTLTANQALDISKVTVYPDSSNSPTPHTQLIDINVTEIWESNWGGGYGNQYNNSDNPIRPESPVSISFIPNGVAIPSFSGLTLYPRNGNGDWLTFHVVVKTLANPEGSTVYSHTGGRVNAVKHINMTDITQYPTEIIIYVTSTNWTTAAMNEIVLWE